MGKITVVCPKCGREMEIPGEQKNTRIECSACGVFFMAYEAVKCENCGRFRHPNHPCKCLSSRNGKAGAAPSSGRSRMKRSVISDLAKKAEEEEAKERAVEVAFRSLPENIQAVFEHEAAKYEKLLAEMTERIEALESAVTDLEAESEGLREE